MVSSTTHLERIFYRHEVVWHRQAGRNAIGEATTVDKTIRCNVNTKAVAVVGEDGKETIAAATLTTSPKNGLPRVGDHMTLPDRFGLKPRRRVISVSAHLNGVPGIPERVEIQLQ